MTDPTITDRVAAQLSRELGEAAHRIAVLAGPDETLDWPRRLHQRAESLAQTLLSDDDREAAQTCIDIMAALWPHGDPETVGQAEWWRTPLGQACARTTDHDEAQSVTRAVAAAILGVSPGTVAQLSHRGTIARHPDGGLVRADVFRYLARRSA